MAHLSWIKTFGTNYCCYFHLPIAPFHCEKLKQFLTADPELWRCAIFGSKMVNLPQTKFFLENYYYHFHLPVSPFHCAKFKKKNSSGSRVLKNVIVNVIFAPKMAHFPKWDFFSSENLLISLVFIIHAFLHAKNRSHILKYFTTDDLKILKSHWPRAIFVFNLRTGFFPSMQFSQDVIGP